MRRSTLPLRLQSLEDRCTPTAVSWDGGAGNLLWNSAANWSNDQLPGSSDSVTISGASGSVSLSGTGATVAQLTLNNDLIVDGVGLTDSGPLNLSAGKLLKVQNLGSFSAAGATSLASASVSAFSGSSVSLPGLTTLSAPTTGDTQFWADGAGSLLSMPNLSSVLGSPTLNNRFIASTNGTISVPTLSKLDNGLSQIYSSDSGVIQAASLTQLDNDYLWFDTSAGFPYANLTSFKHGSINGYGGTATFSALTTFASSSVFANNGTVISMPGVTTVPAAETEEPNFQASDAGSVLTMGGLTTVAPSSFVVRFRAMTGGTVSVPNVTALNGVKIELRSDNGGAMNFNALSSMTGPVGDKAYLSSYQGSIKVSSSLTTLNGVNLIVRNAADFPTNQLISFSHADMQVGLGNSPVPTVTFNNLTTLNSVGITASRAVATFPLVTNFPAPDRDVTFSGFSIGARLEFPALTSIGGNSSNTTFLRATSGGVLSMPALTQLTAGKSDLFVNGTNSQLDLSGLTTIIDPTATTGQITVTGSGLLTTAPSLSLDRLNLNFDDTGKFSLSNLSLGSAVTATGFGTLKANVTNAGVIQPQMPTAGAGLLTINGNYTQTATGQLAIRLGGTASNLYDRLAVTGQATLDGSLAVSLMSGHLPVLSNTYQPVTFGSLSGFFANYYGLTQNSVELQPTYNSANVTLTGIAPNQPTISSVVPAAAVSVVNYVDVTFSEAMNGGSFTIADVGVVGPAGPYGATSIMQTGPNQFRVNVTPLASQGSYTITIGPGINDAAGNAMPSAYAHQLSVTLPNLNVTTITGVPATANFGQNLSVGWTVQNNAGGTASGSWIDRVWLSQDTVLDGTDIALGDATISTTLNPAGTYNGSKLVHLPTNPAQPDGKYYVLVQTDALNAIGETVESDNVTANSSITLSNPPRVASVRVNDGNVQRSRINQLTVTFTEAVTIPLPTSQAFSVTRNSGPGAPQNVPLTAMATSPTVVQIDFLNSPEFVNGSLLDGTFTLKVLSNKVTDGSLNLDGNSDGGTSDYQFNFYRKFGDGNGDNAVDQTDYLMFRNVLTLPSFTFDYNNDNTVDQVDYLEFRNRIGT
ncbi:MAG: Ig-like domain-containing protein [Gemmataceae bacterium]